MQMPENVEDFQRFCGFVNYLAKFLPKLSDVLKHFRNLTRADVMWNWTTVHDRAFKTVQKPVTEASVRACEYGQFLPIRDERLRKLKMILFSS